MLRNCHLTVTESKMSETGATTQAPEGARAVAGVNDEPSQQNKTPQDNNKTENSIPSAVKPNTMDLRSPDAVDPGAIPSEETPSSEAGPQAPPPPPSAPRGPAAEIELKLLVDADRLAGFNDAPVIATNARSKGTRKHLKAVYYDTPERTLLHSGLTLRVRQSGARFMQTVKSESADDPLRRGEWEASV